MQITHKTDFMKNNDLLHLIIQLYDEDNEEFYIQYYAHHFMSK